MSLKRKRQTTASEVNRPPKFAPEAVAEAEPDDPDREPPPKRVNASRSLFVRSLPADATTESLAEHFSQSFPIKHATVVLDPITKKARGYGFVTFADEEDAQRAKEELDGSAFNGRSIKVEVAEPRHRNREHDGTRAQPSPGFVKAQEERRQQRDQLPPKLIVRNLPWSVKTEEQLGKLFMSYGKIKQVNLPKVKPGLSPGFGFVILKGRKNAEKAMAGLNGKEVDGRTIAVDWAVQKDVWQAAQTVEPKEENIDDVSMKSEDDEGGVKLDQIPLSDAEFEDLPSEDDESNAEDLKSEDELDDDSLDEDEKANETEDKSPTLFIRNLPFTTTDDTLYEHFKSFGPLRYARVVMDHETERSRGTGFVCFHKVEDAKECLRKSPKANHSAASDTKASTVKHSLLQDPFADPTGLFTLEGRVLQLSAAVGRGEAQRLTEEGHTAREARDKDKRHLYLLSEGTISSKSPMYASISSAELKMREDSAKQRQTLIRNNPTLHISLIRLAIRNIPRFVTSKDLKALARKAVVGFAKDVKEGVRSPLSAEELSRGGQDMKDAERDRKARGRGVVKQAKVVFEGKEGGKVEESTGAGKSRGYGFIEFSTHRWALMALRWLNGYRVEKVDSQDGNTNEAKKVDDRPKRLIAEFAIENAQVVARRREREQKARERQTGTTEVSKSNYRSPTLARKGFTKYQSKDRIKLERGSTLNGQASLSKASGTSQSPPKSDDTASKASKRQQIIGRKRAMRKARKRAA